MLFEGITPDKFFNVTGLMPATPYFYRVKSHYVNGTESQWSNTKEVLLKEATSMPGDVTMDGIVDITDVTALIDYVLNNKADGIDAVAADLNNDNNVDVQDVVILIELVLGGGE